MLNRKWLLPILIVNLICFYNLALSQGPPLNRVVVFGDSLSDTGNLYQSTRFVGDGFPFEGPNALFPIEYFPDGRFSNGPIWMETFAPASGFSTPQNFVFGGTNFAFGGAETGVGLSQRNSPNIGTQIGFFAQTYGLLNSGDLVVVWAGSNDFNPIPPDTLPATEQVVANLVSRISELHALGGEYFLVPNLPPLGDVPQVRAEGPFVSLLVNLASLQFNLQLESALNDLEQDLGVTIFRFNTFGLVVKATDQPQKFGFTNVTDAAFDLAAYYAGDPDPVVSNPEEYLYWDTIHPTTDAHALLGKIASGAYLTDSMKLALNSNESWGVEISGWFASLQKFGLVTRLNIARFHLDRGNLSSAATYLRSFRRKVSSLARYGRISQSDADWLIDTSNSVIDCLVEIQN